MKKIIIALFLIGFGITAFAQSNVSRPEYTCPTGISPKQTASPTNNNSNSTISTKRTVCTDNGASVYGNGAKSTTCTTTYQDGSKKTEITTCKQGGVSVSGVGGIKANSTISDCTTTIIDTPAPSNRTEDTRKVVPRPKRN